MTIDTTLESMAELLLDSEPTAEREAPEDESPAPERYSRSLGDGATDAVEQEAAAASRSDDEPEDRSQYDYHTDDPATRHAPRTNMPENQIAQAHAELNVAVGQLNEMVANNQISQRDYETAMGNARAADMQLQSQHRQP